MSVQTACFCPSPLAGALRCQTGNSEASAAHIGSLDENSRDARERKSAQNDNRQARLPRMLEGGSSPRCAGLRLIRALERFCDFVQN